MSLLVAFIALITLSSPFGDAEAAAISLDDGLVIDVVVEVSGVYEAVLARPFSSFEELPPTALVDLGDGTWGGLVELPTEWNWSIAFEAITRDGEATRSDGATLIQLGVDPVVVGIEPTGPTPGQPIPASTWWLVGGIVCALAALGVLAWWTFSDENPEPRTQNPDDADHVEDGGEVAADESEL